MTGADGPHEAQLRAWLAADHWRLACLEAAAALDLPDGWIGAGFLRSLVWDRLHGHSEATPLNDIDVLYFDPEDRSRAAEAALEARLRRSIPGLPWSVRNQARMHLRNGVKMGSGELVDTMLRDGLLDAFNGYHMGNTAENVAEQWQITREQQDEFAAASQQKAEAAQKAGKFKDEIIPVTVWQTQTTS